MSDPVIKRALVSVTDKAGVVEFCRALVDEFGVEIVSTGGTAKALADAGVPVRPIDDLTGFPEMMDGRVKTLHPRVHGGLLARRDVPAHMAAAEEHGIGMIDLVCVNLYAFEAPSPARVSPRPRRSRTSTSADRRCCARRRRTSRASRWSPSPQATKTSSPRCAPTAAPRRFRRVARWRPTCSARRRSTTPTIWQYLSRLSRDQVPARKSASACSRPRTCATARTRTRRPRSTASPTPRSTRSRAPSSCRARSSPTTTSSTPTPCWTAVREFAEPCCVIVKHTNPCGTCIDADITTAYRRAQAADPISAYGGVMAFNRTVPASVIEAISENKQFVEVMIAPDYEPAALELLAPSPTCACCAPAACARPAATTTPLGRGRHARAGERLA